MENSAADDQELKTKLNKEAAKIGWQELERFYASGAMVAVGSGMDLIEVACQFSQDNSAVVQAWLAEGQVYKVDDKQAISWQQQQAVLWAVVVAPWVLVQEVAPRE